MEEDEWNFDLGGSAGDYNDNSNLGNDITWDQPTYDQPSGNDNLGNDIQWNDGSTGDGTGNNYDLGGATLDNGADSAWDNYFNAGDNSMSGNQSGDFSMFGGNTSDSGTWSDGSQWGNGSNDHDGSVSNNSNYHDSDWGFAQGKDTSQFSTTGDNMSSNANSYKESTPTGEAEVGSFKDATATDNIEASKREVGNTNADLDPETTGAGGNKNPAGVDQREKVLDRIEQIESRGKANAKAGTSSASGSFQFTDKTWLATVKQAQPDWAQGMSKQEILDSRFDKDKSREMAGVLTDNNQNFLEKRGIEATPGALYGAHFLGAGGASKVYGADPSTPIGQVVNPAQLAANPGVFQRNNIQTAGDFVNWSENKMGLGGGSGGNTQYASLGGGAPSNDLGSGRSPLPPERPSDLYPAMGMPSYNDFSGNAMSLPDSTIGGGNQPMGMPAYGGMSGNSMGNMGDSSAYMGMGMSGAQHVPDLGTAQAAGLNDARATDPYGFSNANMGSMGNQSDMPFGNLMDPTGPAGMPSDNRDADPLTGNSNSRYADAGGPEDGVGSDQSGRQASNNSANRSQDFSQRGNSSNGGGNGGNGNGGGYQQQARNQGGNGNGGGNAQNSSLGNALQQLMGGRGGQQAGMGNILSQLMGMAQQQGQNPFANMSPQQMAFMQQQMQRQQMMQQRQAAMLQQQIASRYGAPHLPGQSARPGAPTTPGAAPRMGHKHGNYGKNPAQEAKYAQLREELRRKDHRRA